MEVNQETKKIYDLISFADKYGLLFKNICEKGENKDIFSYKINTLCLVDIIQFKFYEKIIINIVFYPSQGESVKYEILKNFFMYLDTQHEVINNHNESVVD